jgi:hypothetical protein
MWEAEGPEMEPFFKVEKSSTKGSREVGDLGLQK